MLLSFRQAQMQEHTENIGSPKVAIEPAYQARIQKAVDIVNQHNPGLLNEVTDVIGHMSSSEFGQYSTAKPHTIMVNINRIEQEVRSKLSGKSEEDIQREVDNQITKTIIHESTHRKEIEQSGNTSESGPEAAEKEADKFLQST